MMVHQNIGVKYCKSEKPQNLQLPTLTHLHVVYLYHYCCVVIHEVAQKTRNVERQEKS